MHRMHGKRQQVSGFIIGRQPSAAQLLAQRNGIFGEAAIPLPIFGAAFNRGRVPAIAAIGVDIPLQIGAQPLVLKMRALQDDQPADVKRRIAHRNPRGQKLFARAPSHVNHVAMGLRSLPARHHAHPGKIKMPGRLAEELTIKIHDLGAVDKPFQDRIISRVVVIATATEFRIFLFLNYNSLNKILFFYLLILLLIDLILALNYLKFLLLILMVLFYQK